MNTWYEWQCVFIREERGIPLECAVKIIADRELGDAEIETLGRACLTIAHRDAYRVYKIRQVKRDEIRVIAVNEKMVQAKMF